MTHVLVPIEVLKGEIVSSGLIDLLASTTVTLLGYHEIPEQTPPDQARSQFEDRATEILEDICDEFEAAGGTAYSRLVFTHDREASINRVAAEIDVDATMVVQPTPDVNEVYVALGTPEEVPLLASVLGDIIGDVATDVFLRYFRHAEGPDDPKVGEDALADLRDGLIDAGLSGDRIDTAIQNGKKAVGPIVADAKGRGIDLVVLSDPDLSIGEFIFGDIEERIATHLLAPVLVVRKPPTDASK